MKLQDMEYLGDAVYAGHDGYQVWLTLNSHENEPLIALEPAVLSNLVNYANRHLKDAHRLNKE